MRVVGNFLIASYSEDVVSGLAIDAAPASTYLWTFVLPTYDNLPFLHMTLGERVATFGSGDDCFGDAYETYRQSLDGVTTADDLLKYLDLRKILVRLGNFAEAEDALDRMDGLPVSKGIRQSMEKVRNALRSAGWPNAQRLLGEWSDETGRLIGKPLNVQQQ